MFESNERLAALFLEMADSLTLEGANPYRIRAYRKASDVIKTLSEPIEAVAQRHALQSIPGIGKDLSAKIQEFLKTGTIPSSDPDPMALPEEVAGWVTLPGFSPRLVRYVYHQLGMKTLADLEALVESHMLQTLPGFRVPDQTILTEIRRRRAGHKM